jgi:hypothetical protein
MVLLTFSSSFALVMINPAGHAKNVGRRIVDDYERSVSFKMAEVLKERLQDEYGIRVILTRYPGEEIVELQNASFANRLGVDFYIDLRICRQELLKPQVFVYYLMYDPMVDLVSRTFDDYKFVPVKKAHFFNISKTVDFATKLKTFLSQESYKKSFDCLGIFGIPLKPLVGIVAPAICLELSISGQDQWKTHFVEPIVKSLSFLGKG